MRHPIFKNPWFYFFAFVLIVICCCSLLGILWLGNRLQARTEATGTAVAGSTVTVREINTVAPLATAMPTYLPTNTPVSTATPVELSRKDLYTYCLDLDAIHPDSGNDLIFALDPYAANKAVVCEFEVFSLTEDIEMTIPAGTGLINAEWFHGYQYESNGTLTDVCETGPECEGVNVIGSNDHDVKFTVKRGTLAHFYFYDRLGAAVNDFIGKGPNDSSFACRYIKYDNKDHTNENIRVSPEYIIVFENPADVSIWDHPQNCPLP